MATVILKSNAARGTVVLIPDLGIIVDVNGTNALTFTNYRDIFSLQESKDLRAFLVDDAHGANSSTLILNDGTSDIAQGTAAVQNWLDVASLLPQTQEYGIVKANSEGDIPNDIIGDGSAQLTDWLLGSNLTANGFTLTGLPAVPGGSTDAASKAYVDAVAATSRTWKEIVLHPNQFDSVNDGLSQATAFYLDGLPIATDTLVISDGTTTETFLFKAALAVAFDVLIGANADDTMDNLVTAINTDSTLWGAVQTAGLSSINDGSGTSTAGEVTIIYRLDQAVASYDDRIYTSGANTTPANWQYVNFFGETDYISSVSANLAAADPAQKEFGIGRDAATLLTGQTHLERSSDNLYTWDGDALIWNVSGTGIPYALVGDIAPLGSALAAGVSANVARGDHVHTHGDRGTDGTVSQHDADQVDVEGAYPNIGSPTEVETALSNINTALGGSKAGKLLAFGNNQFVPPTGTLFLEGPGGVVSSAAGYRAIRTGDIIGYSVQLDSIDATRTYDVSIRINGTQQANPNIATSVQGQQSTALSVAYNAGDVITVAMVLSTGSGASSFDDIVVLLEMVDD